jgi:hypothetical protein
MNQSFGYRSYYSVYENVMLYGPRPINSDAASIICRKKHGGLLIGKKSQRSKIKRAKSRFTDQQKTFEKVTLADGSRIFIVPAGTVNK